MTALARTARLMFAGGGTGGHLFPAIAIADRITALLGGSEQVEILFIGTRRGIEYQLRDSLGYPLALINVRGLARSLSLSNLLVPFLLVGAIVRMNSLINRFRPHVVIGTGGYVSLPALQVAGWKGIVTVVQEQNSFPGIATRKLAPGAVRVYLGFAEAQHHLKTRGSVMVTGNPVRPAMTAGDRGEALKRFGLDPARKTILVLGGSQGARSINNAVLRSLNAAPLPEDYQLLWQTGKRDYKDVIAKAGDRVEPHALFPYENNMALVYAAADLAIARAGALTLAELQACAVPSILIPFPHAAGDHQRKNARQMEASGFAKVVDNDDLEREDILLRAIELSGSGRADEIRRKITDHNARSRAAVDIIAEDIVDLVKRQQEQEEAGAS